MVAGASYPVLIVEDDGTQAVSYRNAIKKACKGLLRVSVSESETGEDALGKLANGVWPFLSLDQKIPMHYKGVVSVENGVTVGVRSKLLQPFQYITVLTGAASVTSLRRLSGKDLQYFEKSEDVADPTKYGELLVGRVVQFERSGVWSLGAELLPPGVAYGCEQYLASTETGALASLKACCVGLSSALHLTLLCLLSVVDCRSAAVSAALRRSGGSLSKQGSAVALIRVLAELVRDGACVDMPSWVRSEITRFIASSDFLEVLDACAMARNEYSHKSSAASDVWCDRYLSEVRSWFAMLLVYQGFWSLHPLVSGLRVQSTAGTAYLDGFAFRGTRAPLVRSRWSWDGVTMPDSERVYVVLSNPNRTDQSFLIDLHPLVRVAENSNGERVLWLADRPGASGYMNAETDDKREFDDSELSSWWSDARDQAANSFVAAAREREEAAVQRDELDYVAEEQAWYVADWPNCRTVPQESLLSTMPSADVFIVTATDVELRAALGLLQPLGRRRKIAKVYDGTETYFVGRLGSFACVVTKCRMGSIGEGNAALAIDHGLQAWTPRAVVMCGIAFGNAKRSVSIADVLVATAVIPYEKQRVGTNEVIFRAPIPPASSLLLNRFENATEWKFMKPDGRPAAMHVGQVLSGEKLIDNQSFRDGLLSQFPEAIGGEMEGAGLCAASGRLRVPWILVKAVCDWADGTKNKKHQQLAAASSLSLVQHVFAESTVLDSI